MNLPKQLKLGMSVAAVLLTAIGFAIADSVTTSTGTSGLNTVVTITVSATGAHQIRDLHFFPVDTNKSMKGVGAGGPTGWLPSLSGKGLHFRAGSGAAITTANSPQTFTITIPTSQFNSGIVRWVTTSDNNDNATTGVIQTGPGEGAPTPNGPVSNVVCTTSTATRGGITNLQIQSTEPSRAYELYAVSTNVGLPLLSDYASFVTWAGLHPVSPGWGLSFSNMTGSLNSGGGTTSPTVTIPNNPSLDGQKFYLVAYASSEPDDNSVSYMLADQVTEVTILP